MSSAEEDDGLYEDGYGSDLMGDAEDRARLMALTELDRELILLERSEARDNLKEKQQHAKLLKQRQRATEMVEQAPVAPLSCCTLAAPATVMETGRAAPHP